MSNPSVRDFGAAWWPTVTATVADTGREVRHDLAHGVQWGNSRNTSLGARAGRRGMGVVAAIARSVCAAADVALSIPAMPYGVARARFRARTRHAPTLARNVAKGIAAGLAGAAAAAVWMFFTPYTLLPALVYAYVGMPDVVDKLSERANERAASRAGVPPSFDVAGRSRPRVSTTTDGPAVGGLGLEAQPRVARAPGIVERPTTSQGSQPGASAAPRSRPVRDVGGVE